LARSERVVKLFSPWKIRGWENIKVPLHTHKTLLSQILVAILRDPRWNGCTKTDKALQKMAEMFMKKCNPLTKLDLGDPL